MTYGTRAPCNAGIATCIHDSCFNIVTIYVCRILPRNLHATVVLNRLTHVLDSIYMLRIPVK